MGEKSNKYSNFITLFVDYYNTITTHTLLLILRSEFNIFTTFSHFWGAKNGTSALCDHVMPDIHHMPEHHLPIYWLITSAKQQNTTYD